MIPRSIVAHFCFILASCFFLAGNAYGQEKYTGAEGCNCHKSEITDWEGSRHAKAFDLLLPGKRLAAKKAAGLNPRTDYSNDPKCISCHVVGYKQDGGFVDFESTPLMAGVGCESCHGPGGSYRILHGKKPLTFTRQEAMEKGQLYSSDGPQVCRTCHEHKDSPFQPHINKKYSLDYKKGLETPELFHNYYPLKAKH